MNYFKYSPLPKLAANRLRRHQVRNPNKILLRDNQRVENLDIMKVYAQREAKESKMQPRYKGGDDLDRLDYIKEQKARLGFKLDRMLSLTNKRMPSGHYLKDDQSYLEFNNVIRGREIQEGLLQPGDMQWSVDHFL